MNKGLIIVIITALIYSCQPKNEPVSTSNNDSLVTQSIEPVSQPIEAQEDIIDEIGKEKEDAVEVDFTKIELDPIDLPRPDSALGIQILTIGQFHNEEVDSDWTQEAHNGKQ